MKIFIGNSPWYKTENNNNYYFVRAGSRWPHFEKFNSDGSICYMPYPFFMGYTSILLKKQGFEVLTVDGAAELLTEKKFIDKIINFEPDIVLLEVSAVSIAKDLDDARFIKSKIKTEIVFTGLYSFMYNSEFLEKYQFVDYVIIGEYENIFLELCNYKSSKTIDLDLSKIKGLIFRTSDNKVINTGRAELINNLDMFDFPDREALPLKNYLDLPGGISKPSAQIITSRGCPFGCIFCAWPQIIYGGNKFRQRSVDNVINEIKFLKEKYNIKSVYFDDDTFNVNQKFVQDLSKKIIAENIDIEWAAMCRADIMTEETLVLMKQAGLKAVKYGVESASPEILKNIDKSLDIEKVIKTIELTKKNDIKVHLTFCFGLPGETKNTIKATIKLAKHLQPDSAQFSIATPFPGSKYFEMLKKNGRLLTEDFAKYDGYNNCVISHENLEPTELIAAVKKAQTELTKILIKKKSKKIIDKFINKNNKIIFTGLTDYNKPYTRVRCYDFSNQLNALGFDTKVYSYQEQLFPNISGEDMLGLSEFNRVQAFFKSFIALAAEQADYLYLQKIHYHAAAPYILAKLKLKKLILDYDDFDFDRSPMFKISAINKLIFGSNDIWKITENIAKISKACIISSNYLVNIFKKFNDKTFYIPTGVDTDKFYINQPRNLPTDKIIFLWNGMVWGEIMYNNVLFLIECFAEVYKQLKQQNSSIKLEFNIAGDGGYMPKLMALKDSKFKDLPINFKGFISPNQMPQLLNNATIGLLPLIPDAQNKEWLESKSPTKLFEYLAMALPTVAHNFGECKYILKNGYNGLLADDKENFIKQMLNLIQNKELYQRISENALKTAQNEYSQKILVHRLSKILAEIVNN